MEATEEQAKSAEVENGKTEGEDVKDEMETTEGDTVSQTENQDDVEMKEENENDEIKEEPTTPDKDPDNKDEAGKNTSVEKVEEEDEEVAKHNKVDQIYKAEFLKAVSETVTIEPVKSQLLRNEEFIGLLTKAKALTLELDNQLGNVKMSFAPYREWMAMRILKGINRLQQDDSKLNVECSEGFRKLLDTEKSGKLKGALREQLTAKSLYINNIPKDTTEETLQAFFPKCLKVILPRDQDDVLMGWAVAEFNSAEDTMESFNSQKEIEIGSTKASVSRIKLLDVRQRDKRMKGGKGRQRQFQNKRDGQKGPGNRSDQGGDMNKSQGQQKNKGGAQNSAMKKANDLKRKAQNQNQKMQQNQKRRRMGSMDSGSQSMGNQNRNRRNSGMNRRQGMSLLGVPTGSRMMNLGIGLGMPNMMGIGRSMNMMGMGNPMGGAMGNPSMGMMSMMGNSGMGMSSMNTNRGSLMGNQGQQKDRGRRQRGGSKDNRGQWSGGPGQSSFHGSGGSQGRMSDYGRSDDLQSKLNTVLSNQRRGQDSDSDMVSMLESALKAAQKRMSEKSSSSGDWNSSRMSNTSPGGMSGSMNQSKKMRPRPNKKQSMSGKAWGSGSGSSFSGKGTGSGYGRTESSYSRTESSYDDSGNSYGSSRAGFGTTLGGSYESSGTGTGSSFSGGNFGGSLDRAPYESFNYDHGVSSSQPDSYDDSYGRSDASLWDDYSGSKSQPDSMFGSYRSGYY